jgi:hypothetical protein
MLSFSRRTGGKTPLFGSSIEHSDTIAMTLRHGEITRGLNTDWYYGDKIIAEAEMSYSQFAECITSMNMGSGVPVTIRLTEKDGRITPCDFVNKKEQFQNELKDRLNNANELSMNLAKEVAEIFDKKTLNKSDKQEIMGKINHIIAEVSSNASFTYDCFNEQMDKTITEAKGEIEAFCQNKINSIAQSALVEHRDELLHLENPVDVDMLE